MNNYGTRKVAKDIQVIVHVHVVEEKEAIGKYQLGMSHEY